MAIQMADNGYIMVPRADWGARGRDSRGAAMQPGQREVNIHHSVLHPSGPEGYDSDLDPTDDPCADMRRTEQVLMARGLDPGYSFCIHPSGVVLEGAGTNIGAHTAYRNSRSYGICFMGNYDIHQPTLAQLVAAARTVNILRMTGKLVPMLADITIQGHRDTKATACPGKNVYDHLRWIRWFAHKGT